MANKYQREVAQKLREIEPSKTGDIEWWKIAQALNLVEMDNCFGWERFKRESVLRLADLIDIEHHVSKAFDADGFPIEVDDIVYFAKEKSRKAYTVKAVNFYDCPVITLTDGSFDCYSTIPAELTHKRPDNWEILEEDVYHLVTRGYLDRPDEDVKSIMRRAKALAKKVDGTQ
ncbi:MAG: hypothetical protein EGR23_12255 [Holdemanella biformis]|nr:hypothetical protein [Holdemanella biformis]